MEKVYIDVLEAKVFCRSNIESIAKELSMDSDLKGKELKEAIAKKEELLDTIKGLADLYENIDTAGLLLGIPEDEMRVRLLGCQKDG